MRIPRILAHFRQFVFAVFVTALTFLTPAFACEENQIECNNQCYDAFTVTLTDAATSFSFSIAATGTFCIDWGGTTTSVQYEQRSTTASSSISAPSGFGKTIKIGGLATGYNTGNVASISFYSNTNVKGFSGSIGKVFPTLSDNTSNLTGTALAAVQPSFYRAFYGCSNWTGAIPVNLFSGIKGTMRSNMFYQAFRNCSGLTGSVPPELFRDMDYANSPMSGIFASASGLASSCTSPETDYSFYTTSPWPTSTYTSSGIWGGKHSCIQSGSIACRTGEYRDANGVCATCPAGYYCADKATIYATNDTGRTMCPANTYNASTGSTDLSYCLSCPTGTVSPAGSTSVGDCVFNCPADATVNGTNDGCVCNDSAYAWNSTSNTCIFSCPADATVNGTNDGCVCNDSTNYTWNSTSNTCIFNCPVDATVNGTNDGCVCNDSVNYTWDSLTNTCIANVACPTNATYSSTTEQCEPNIGYKWTDSTHTACAPIEYSVVFNSNALDATGSTSGMPNLSYGTSYTLTSNGFTRTGYNFDGWCVGATTCAAADKLVNGASVSNLTTTDGATVALYARWTAKTITCLNDGEYLPANSETCATCVAGSYCSNPANTQYTYTGNAQGITSCSTVGDGSYTLSGTGSTTDSQCYKSATVACSTYDPCAANATCSWSGSDPAPCKMYYGAISCVLDNVATDCVKTQNCNTGYTWDGTACELDTYTIAYYNTTGASFVTNNPSTYTIEDSITLNNPTKTGYTFAGWCTGSTTCNNPSMNISFSAETGDKEYFAKWTANTYTVTYDCNSSDANSVTPSSATAIYDNSFTPDANVNKCVKDGYTFDGWCDGSVNSTTGACAGTVRQAGVEIQEWKYTDNVTFTAKWLSDSGCANGYINAQIDSGDVFPTQYTPATTYPKGRAYIDPDDGSCVATSNNQFTLNCNGLNSNEFKVKFSGPNGGNGGMIYGTWMCNANGENDTGVSPSSAVDRDPDPTLGSGKACYCRLDKYSLDGSSEIVPVYVWAHVRNYSSCNTMCASFCADGFAQYMGDNTNLRSILYTKAQGAHCVYNCPVGQTVNSSNDGCISNTCPNNAHLDEATDTCVYHVNYVLNGGDLPSGIGNPTLYSSTLGNLPLTLPAPTKTGYMFDGWYDNSDFTGSVVTEVPAGSTNDKTFYAKWSPITYTITYYTNDGTLDSGINNPTNYTIESSTITLPTGAEITRTGYVFAGWYNNPSLTGAVVTSVSSGSYGNKEYYAKWLDCASVTPANATAVVGVVNNACSYTITCDTGYSHNTGSAYVIGNITYTHNVAGELPSSITGCETPRINLTWNPESADNAASVSGVGFCDVGATFNVPTVQPARTGYTFVGWDVVDE